MAQSKDAAVAALQGCSGGSQDSGLSLGLSQDTADTLTQSSEEEKIANDATEEAEKSGPTVEDFTNMLAKIKGEERSKLNVALAKVFEDFQSQKSAEADVFDGIFGKPARTESSDPLPGPSRLSNRVATVPTSQPDLLCNFCLSREKNAGIIHGRVIHNVCCYPCAKKLYKKRQPCPMCRRKIEKIAEIIPS